MAEPDQTESGVAREKESTPIKTTESMVTVRLSDTEVPSLPSPTPTLKLVDERCEEYVLGDHEPMFAPERTESPGPTDMSASQRSSTSFEDGENAVDWAGLEKTEGEHTKDQASEEVSTIPRIRRRSLLYINP
jgi:hypothetical protein